MKESFERVRLLERAQRNTGFVPRTFIGTALMSSALFLICQIFSGLSALAKNSSDASSQSVDQLQVNKSLSYLKSGNWPKAAEATENAVAGATDVKSCLGVLSQMEQYGSQANKARRACLSKALNLATTNEELEEVAFAARRAGCVDLSKEALDSLIGSTTAISKLTELAFKANQEAMPDVAHLAMEKAYKLVNNQPDALDFIHQTRNLGLEDLSRQALKDLIDDQASVTDMMTLLPVIDECKMPDLVRYLLKIAVDKAKDTDEMLAVYDAAKKYDQADIVKLAQYRGRKMVLLKKVKTEESSKAEEDAKKDPANALKSPTGF